MVPEPDIGSEEGADQQGAEPVVAPADAHFRAQGEQGGEGQGGATHGRTPLPVEAPERKARAKRVALA